MLPDVVRERKFLFILLHLVPLAMLSLIMTISVNFKGGFYYFVAC